jgi:hypothetical protein
MRTSRKASIITAAAPARRWSSILGYQRFHLRLRIASSLVRRRDDHSYAIQRICHLKLTRQTRSLVSKRRSLEQIVFIVTHLVQGFQKWGIDIDVASRTRAVTAAQRKNVFHSRIAQRKHKALPKWRVYRSFPSAAVNNCYFRHCAQAVQKYCILANSRERLRNKFFIYGSRPMNLVSYGGNNAIMPVA